MITIKAYIQNNSQIEAIKAFMKSQKIKFEVTKDSPYDTGFVNMILDAEKDIKEGKGINLTSEEFDDLWK